MITRICVVCLQPFPTWPCRITGKNGHKALYCSKPCMRTMTNKNLDNGQSTRYQPGHISDINPTLRPRGAKHVQWKGDEVGYEPLHQWIRRIKGPPNACVQCGKVKTTARSIHWANIDRQYRRQPDDFIALCASCHKLHDNNLYRNGNQTHSKANRRAAKSLT
jgi:hypothetical protein